MFLFKLTIIISETGVFGLVVPPPLNLILAGADNLWQLADILAWLAGSLTILTCQEPISVSFLAKVFKRFAGSI